jgi:penicillin-binding protein 1A
MNDASEPKPSGPTDRLRRWTIRLLVAAALSILLGALIVGGVLLYFNSGLPPIDNLASYSPPQVTRLLDRNGVVVADLFEERRTVVPFERIPKQVLQAFLAAEDADFYKHQGLDFPGLLRAFWANLKAGRVVQGGSTITQQVIKTFLLGPERSYGRKIRELLLAFRVESNLTKDEILFLYLNQIYFGHGCYGVQEAGRFYFGKDVQDLSLSDGALLASLPKSPARYSPLRHRQRALERRNWVLDQMARNQMVTAEQAEEAKSTAPVIIGQPVSFGDMAPYYAEHVRRLLEEWYSPKRVLEGGLRVELALDLEAQRAAQAAMRDGLRQVDRRQGYRGPLGRIADTYLAQLRQERAGDLAAGQVWSLSRKTAPAGADQDPLTAWRVRAVPVRPGLRVVAPVVAIEGEAARAVARVDLGSRQAVLGLAGLGWARPFSPVRQTAAPKSVSEVVAVGDVVEVELEFEGESLLETVGLSQPPLVQGALVAIDPQDRGVRALVGGSDFAFTPLIRAVQSRRQPGSAFKPIVYAAALEAGTVTPASILMDTPETYRASLAGKAWKPKNYERVFVGPVSLRHALAHSINTIAVKIASDLGPGPIVEMAHKLGIRSPVERNLSLALGASEVTPLELTNAFTTFASGGRASEPVFVTRVVDPSGKELELPKREEVQAISPAVAYVMTSLLRSVVEDGTGKKALKLGRPAVGKTGTANQQRDGWFVGFVPGLSCGVWVGFDDHSRMGGGWAAGSGTALPIWVQFMESVLAEAPRREFQAPAEVVFVRVDPENGLLAPDHQPGARFEVFVEGTEPRAVSDRVPVDGDSAQTSVSDTVAPLGRMPDGMFR